MRLIHYRGQRCFGFITDVDGYVIDRINDRIKLLENNAENDERVVSGRATASEIFRPISPIQTGILVTSIPF